MHPREAKVYINILLKDGIIDETPSVRYHILTSKIWTFKGYVTPVEIPDPIKIKRNYWTIVWRVIIGILVLVEGVYVIIQLAQLLLKEIQD